MVLGLSLIVTMQAFVNMAVSVGLMPVTGQPLPLISMGGSSVFFTCVAMGMILGVSRESEREQQETEARQRREAILAAGGDPDAVDTGENTAVQQPVQESAAAAPRKRPLILGKRRKTPQDTALSSENDDQEANELTLVDRSDGLDWNDSPSADRREVIDLMDENDE